MNDEGVDLSRYDSAYTTDTSALDDPRVRFAILNIDDPGCSAKAARADELGIPWALYSWLYAGNGPESVTRLEAMADLLELDGIGRPPKGGFVDFEANGVSAGDLRHARETPCRDPLGAYTYLYLLTTLPGLADEWWAWSGRWIAYYPGDNGGGYPAGRDGDARAWGSMLWQFTSSDGTRDRDVIIDPAAWAEWGTPTAPPPDPTPPSRKKVPTMFVTHVIATNTCDLWSETPVKLDTWQNDDSPNAYGIGTKLAGYLAAGIPVVTYATVAEYQAAYNDLMRLAGHYPGPGTT